jgi:hypothetical protein
MGSGLDLRACPTALGEPQPTSEAISLYDISPPKGIRQVASGRRRPIFRLVGEIKLDADKKAVLPLSLDLQGVIEYWDIIDFLFYHFIITDPYHL